VAAAISDAGSQRMRTYRMAYLMAQGLEPSADAARLARKLESETALFDSVLRAPTWAIRSGRWHHRRTARSGGLADVERAWRETMAPRARVFLAAAPGQKAAEFVAFEAELEGFVARINDIVLAMEQSYARDTELLRNTQAPLILLALAGSRVMLRFFMQQVNGPLGELRAGMRRMAGNDLAVPPATGARLEHRPGVRPGDRA
jgi:two-component system nitrate/nitrite sensor histidine kinase NarX